MCGIILSMGSARYHITPTTTTTTLLRAACGAQVSSAAKARGVDQKLQASFNSKHRLCPHALLPFQEILPES